MCGSNRETEKYERISCTYKLSINALHQKKISLIPADLPTLSISEQINVRLTYNRFAFFKQSFAIEGIPSLPLWVSMVGLNVILSTEVVFWVYGITFLNLMGTQKFNIRNYSCLVKNTDVLANQFPSNRFYKKLHTLT